MGDHLIQYNNLFENVDSQRTSRYKTIKKKKKYIACSYDWKEFYSDEEDNSYYNFNLNNNYINQNKLKKSRTFSINSNLTKKGSLKKTNTINKIYGSKLDNKNYFKNKLNKYRNKKVRFQVKNFVKYIDVESYKKYNILNTSSDSSLNTDNDSIPENENNNKVDVKCTCLIY